MGYRTGTDKTVYSTSKPVISFTPGSNTQVVAQFNMNLKKRSKAVKEYKLQWLYKVGNRRIEGSTDTVQAGANGASNSTDAIYNIIYSPPSDAVEVLRMFRRRLRMRLVSRPVLRRQLRQPTVLQMLPSQQQKEQVRLPVMLNQPPILQVR